MGYAERNNPKSLRNLARWEREGAMRNAAEKKETMEKMKGEVKAFIRSQAHKRRKISIPIPKENRA